LRLPILLILVEGVYAVSSDPSPAIATDRPAVTASSIVVPIGSLQFENGLTETLNGGQRTLDGPETLLRAGVAPDTELRLTAPNYFNQSSGMSGFGDLMIGVKRQFGPTPGGFDVSLILSLSMPSGARTISSGGYDPSIQLPWSRSLSPNWTVAGMLSIYWPTTVGGRNVTGETTFLIDRQITKTSDAFVEYAGDFSGLSPRHLIHFGTAFKPTPHQQLDIHAGVGLSRAAVDHFVGIGYSFRLQAFRR
jgi:hypothetical protein